MGFMSPHYVLASVQIMFFLLSGYHRITSSLYNNIVNMFSYYYFVVLGLTLFLFIRYRVPFGYSPFFFIVFLSTMVFFSFLSLFLSRVCSKYSLFFGGFVPVGTPLYICPLVCLAETISFLIRPFVLIFRPFINITLGCFGAVAISSFCFVKSIWFLVLVLLFFYEVFVALVHWFIVAKILSFSVDH